MNKDTKSNHPSPSEDSLLQSKISRPVGLRVRFPPPPPFFILSYIWNYLWEIGDNDLCQILIQR